jgi:hypothetical protein
MYTSRFVTFKLNRIECISNIILLGMPIVNGYDVSWIIVPLRVLNYYIIKKSPVVQLC